MSAEKGNGHVNLLSGEHWKLFQVHNNSLKVLQTELYVLKQLILSAHSSELHMSYVHMYVTYDIRIMTFVCLCTNKFLPQKVSETILPAAFYNNDLPF